MNLFDKIKDAFSNEDEKAAEAAKQAEEQAAAEATAAAAAEQEEATRLADSYGKNCEKVSSAYYRDCYFDTVVINHDADPNVPTGNALDTGVGLLVENALAQVIDYSGPIDGALGTSFIRAYSRFQESLGYSGGDADGYPGTESLTVLGERTGAFRVVG